MKFLYRAIFVLLSLFTSLNAQWVQQLIATSSVASAVTTDDNGNICITGYFGGSGSSGIQFDENTTFWNTGGIDAFVAKYNSAGKLQWANKIGGMKSDAGYDVSMDVNGNVYVMGSFDDEVVFDNTTSLTNYGFADVFIAKYNSDGQLQWANKIGSSMYWDIGNAIASDANNNIYVTGSFGGTANFDSVTALTVHGNSDAFLAKYNSDGELQWANKIGGTNADMGTGINIDNQNNILLIGNFLGTANFGESNTLKGIRDKNTFIAKYNSDGLFQWVNQVSNSNGTDIDTDINNNIVITGSFAEDAKFNETNTLTSNGFGDTYVAQFNTTGELLWAKKIGGEFNDQGFGISTDTVGSIFVSGSFSTTANFDETNTLTTSGADNGYIAKYNSSGNLEWANKIGCTSYSFVYGCVTEQNNNIIVTGSFQGVANFDTSTEMISAGGGADGFLAKYSGTDGSLVITNVEEDENKVPTDFILNQNYPNPFNPSTTIKYQIPNNTHPSISSRLSDEAEQRRGEGKEHSDRGVLITLIVYDILGTEVATLVNETKQTGSYEVQFDASNLTSGIYFYKIQAGSFIETKKMILLR